MSIGDSSNPTMLSSPIQVNCENKSEALQNITNENTRIAPQVDVPERLNQQNEDGIPNIFQVKKKS